MGGKFTTSDFLNQGFNVPKIMVETGTYLGERTEMFAKIFQHVYTVELSEDLYKRTSNRLSQYSNITFIHGDSAKVLSDLCPSIEDRAVFYLDAHWFVDAQPVADDNPMPLFEELHAINQRRKSDVIIVDDVHSFNRTLDDWPCNIVDVPNQAKIWEHVNSQSILDIFTNRKIYDYYPALDKLFIHLQ